MNILIKPAGVPANKELIEKFWRDNPGVMNMFDGTRHYCTIQPSDKMLYNETRLDTEYILWCSTNIPKMTVRRYSNTLWLASNVSGINPSQDEHEYLEKMLEGLGEEDYNRLFKYYARRGQFVTFDKTKKKFKYRKDLPTYKGMLSTTEIAFNKKNKKSNIVEVTQFNWTAFQRRSLPAHYQRNLSIPQRYSEAPLLLPQPRTVVTPDATEFTKNNTDKRVFSVLGTGIILTDFDLTGKNLFKHGLSNSETMGILDRCQTQIYSPPKAGQGGDVRFCLFGLEAGDVIYKIIIDGHLDARIVYPTPEHARNFISSNAHRVAKMIFLVYRYDLMSSYTQLWRRTCSRSEAPELTDSQRSYIISYLIEKMPSTGDLTHYFEEFSRMSNEELLTQSGVNKIGWETH